MMMTGSRDDRVETGVRTLMRTELFAEAGEPALRELMEHARRVGVSAGEHLFSAGDPSLGLFVVVAGRTRAIRHGADGREQVIHEDTPASTFPEVAVFDDGPYPSSVTAVEDSELLFFPKEVVRSFCLRHPEVALSALKVLSRRLRKATGMVETLSLLDVSQRLAQYLVQECPVRNGVLELRHNNQEIADLIGTVREVVSRAFNKLHRLGLIRKRGRVVEILDSEALNEHAAGE
jgi:CRP-like cAMP-binding protein